MQIEKPTISGGRANNDVLLYKHGNSVKFPAFFLGCDSQVITDLTNHLKRFQLRSKVDISQGAELYESWVIFSPSGAVILQYTTASFDILLLERDA